MAIIIKELTIKGRVVRELPDSRLDDRELEEYLARVREEIVAECLQRLREELERNLLID